MKGNYERVSAWKHFDELEASELVSLPTAGVSESRHLEFKSQLPSDKDSDKKEFLYDVAAMVNGGGGAILNGVEEERIRNKSTGRAEKCAGYCNRHARCTAPQARDHY